MQRAFCTVPKRGKIRTRFIFARTMRFLSSLCALKNLETGAEIFLLRAQREQNLAVGLDGRPDESGVVAPGTGKRGRAGSVRGRHADREIRGKV